MEVQKYDNKKTGVSKREELITQYATREGISPEGITILGGKPYINVTGLDRKVMNKCKREKLILKSVKIIERLEEAGPDNQYLSGRFAELVLFDKETYLKTLAKIKEPTIEVIRELRETFEYKFYGEGWASAVGCDFAYTYKKTGNKYIDAWGNEKDEKVKDKLIVEDIPMMAERKATNRAKREATGTGMTSIDEVMGNPNVEEEEAEPGESREVVIEKLHQVMKASVFNDEERKSVAKYVKQLKTVKGLVKIFEKWQKEKEGREGVLEDENKEVQGVEIQQEQYEVQGEFDSA